MYPNKCLYGSFNSYINLFGILNINPVLSVHFSMTQDATGYVCLLIQPTKKDDAGWYTVSAKNEAGIVSCTCRLDIYG